MALSSMFVKLSLTSRALLIRRVFECLSSSWINSLWIFITRFRSTYCLSKLKWHHFPFRQFRSCARYLLILRFCLGILLLRFFYFFLFLILLNELYLIVIYDPFLLHVELLPLFNKHILAYFCMLFISFFIELSIARGAFL